MTRLELDPWVEGYLSYLRDVQRKRPRTIIDVRCTLKQLSAFMAKTRPGTPVWKLGLDDFLAWLNAGRETGRSESVLAKDLSHVRGLLDHTWRSGRCDRNVLDGFSMQHSMPKTPPRSLTLEEAQRLVHACRRGSADERRARLVVLLLYGCGLRTSELVGLDVEDVIVERQEIFVKHGKGGFQRTIPVPASVFTELLAYMTERGGKRGPLLRTLARRRRLGPKDVGDIVKSAAIAAGLDGRVTARTLRHTFGTHLMDRGVDLAVISSLMGHRSPTETGVYLHVLPGRSEAAVRTLEDNEEEHR
jgi:site-specific recombinase XerD